MYKINLIISFLFSIVSNAGEYEKPSEQEIEQITIIIGEDEEFIEQYGDKNGEVPLLLKAAYLGNEKVVTYLLSDAGFKEENLTLGSVGQNALHCAIRAHQLEIAKLLLASPYADKFVESDDDGYTALHVAVFSKNTENVKFLLKPEYLKYRHLFIKADCDEQTPLQHATVANYIEILDYFKQQF